MLRRIKVGDTTQSNSLQESSSQSNLLKKSSLTLGKRLKKIFLGSQENSIIMPESTSELTNISRELSQEISQEDINKINQEIVNFNNENKNRDVYIQTEHDSMKKDKEIIFKSINIFTDIYDTISTQDNVASTQDNDASIMQKQEGGMTIGTIIKYSSDILNYSNKKYSNFRKLIFLKIFRLASLTAYYVLTTSDFDVSIKEKLEIYANLIYKYIPKILSNSIS